ncbi:MAG: PEP-CTERM sorting domain-containing protein [Planctomycetia bacterium]|nr:PEP-CTERM sorting domain-containing protein [Planctomycetia bacterium]
MEGAESTFTATHLRVGNYGTTGLFTQNAGTVTLGFTTIGEAGSGTYRLYGGTLTSNSQLVLGVDNGTVGVMEMRGGSASMTGLVLGWNEHQGTGKFYLHDGTLTSGTLQMGGSRNQAANLFVQTGGTAYIGDLDGVSHGTVQISGGTLNVTGNNEKNWRIGGTWNISGGKIIASNYLFFGEAQVTMTGGEIHAQLRVGNAGNTGWMVQRGGSVTSPTWLTIGENGSGKYTLEGGTVTHSGGGAFVLGVDKGTRGELEMNGGTMNLLGDMGMALGWANNSVGSAVINDGTLNVTHTIQVGRDSTGASSFTQNGGEVTAGSIAIKAGNQYTLAGGKLSTPTITNNGTFSMTGGLLAPGGVGTIGTTTISGNFSPTGGTIHLDVSSTASDQLFVGGNSSATEGMLQIAIMGSGYGSFTREVTLVQAGGSGTITKTITSTEHLWDGTTNSWNTAHWNNGVLPAGSEYDTFSIQKGTVTLADANNATANRLTVGSEGTLSVTPGNYTNPFVNIDFVYLNEGGKIINNGNLGNLTGTWVIDGGTLDSSGRNFRMGTAHLTLKSGSITALDFRVGNAGDTGWMVQDGGAVTSTNYLTVGESGSGKYTINGGTVTANNVALGVDHATTGTLIINGGTTTVTDTLYMGYNSGSTGILKLNGGTLTTKNWIQNRAGGASATSTQNGGEVRVTETMTLNAGSYTLNDGTFHAKSINQNGGVFNFAGGLLDVGETNFALIQEGGNFSPGGDDALGTSRLMGMMVEGGIWTLNLTSDNIDEILIADGGTFFMDALEGIWLESLDGWERSESPLQFLTFEGEKVEGLTETLNTLLNGTIAHYYSVVDTATGYALVAVPEPGSWLLLLLGLGCWFGWQKKRGGKK